MTMGLSCNGFDRQHLRAIAEQSNLPDKRLLTVMPATQAGCAERYATAIAVARSGLRLVGPDERAPQERFCEKLHRNFFAWRGFEPARPRWMGAMWLVSVVGSACALYWMSS